MTVLKFEAWLIDQQDRTDLIGALARVPSMYSPQRKFSKSKRDEHKDWVNIVISIAEPGYIYVFNDAWQEYLGVKEAAENESEEL
jgi:hypothetical protein